MGLNKTAEKILQRISTLENFFEICATIIVQLGGKSCDKQIGEKLVKSLKRKNGEFFFDDEAEVGTTDDEDEMETEGTLKKKKQRTNMISSDEDDESDDEEKAREEMQGFIADDADDLDEPVRQKKEKETGKTISLKI